MRRVREIRGKQSQLQSLEYTILSQPADVAGLSVEWDSRANAEHGNLYTTFEWVHALWEAHLECRGVEFNVFREGPTLRGVVPLTRKTIRKFLIPMRFLSLLTNRYGRNHNDLILFGDREEVFLALMERLKEETWDILLLGSLVEGGLSENFVRALEREGSYRIVADPYVQSPYLELSGTWASYLEGRSSNFRSDLKRKQQRAEQAGMEVRMITEPSGVPETLRAFYEIETRSWKEVTGTSITAQPHARRFYDVFLPTAARRGWFLGFVLYLGGRPVAFDMGVLYAQKYYMLKTSYDQEWRDVSPGFVLRACVIEELFRRGVREHDFLGDPEPWKLRWTDAVRRHWNLYLYNTRRPVANLMAIGQLLRRRAL